MNGLLIHHLGRKATEKSHVSAADHDNVTPKQLEQTRRSSVLLFVEIHLLDLSETCATFFRESSTRPRPSFYNGVGRLFYYSSSLSLPSLKSIPALFVGLLFAMSSFSTWGKKREKPKKKLTSYTKTCFLTS